MYRAYSKLIAGLPLAAACTLVQADGLNKLIADYQEVSAQGKTVHIVDIDNDSLMLNRNDGFYTSGLRYARRHTIAGASAATTFGWRLGQELYTASDIKLPAELVGPPDRPYAGWLYGGFFKEVRRIDGTHSNIGLDVGCLGPCAGGKWTQNVLHRILNQPLPQGWSKQVGNELGIVLHGDVTPVRWHLGSSADITPSLKARFGNIFTDLGAGVTVRAGQLNLLSEKSPLYGFLRMDARAVGYNATLQGGYFSRRNVHTVAPERFVGEAEIGLAWNGETYGVRASLIRRSSEVRNLPSSIAAQNYISLQFSYTP